MASEKIIFANPNEELAYLRARVLEEERKLEHSGAPKLREEVVRGTIKEFEKDFGASSPDAPVINNEERAVSLMKKHTEHELEEMMQVTEKKGILHALGLVEKMRGWKLEDDFHDFLVGLVSKGLPPIGVAEKGPVFKALHMTLLEVILTKGSKDGEKPLSELIKSMEQLYAGFLSIASEKAEETNYMVFEIANPEGAEDTQIFVSVPTSRKDLFERQLLSIFPNAKVIPRERDYNIFNEFGTTLGAVGKLASASAYPLKTFEAFGEDPLNVVLNSFSKIPKAGAGAALQIIFRPVGNLYTDKYSYALKKIEKGEDPRKVLKEESIAGEVGSVFSQMLFGKKEKNSKEPPKVDGGVVESIKKKMESPVVEANMRLAVSASTEPEARRFLENLKSAFNQFENAGKNALVWTDLKASKESEFYRNFVFRIFREDEGLPLNLKELSTILHFHTEALIDSTTLKQSSSKGAPPPVSLAEGGTFLGVSNFQGTEKKINISYEDRLRHFYTIGQTGTGKSTLLKNMIIEDIKAGNGVCMIDPHGSDILDVLANIPASRVNDVIYFDPSQTDRPMGLNMLEYDRSKPEQKTFVVNELFNIFQKLYGAVPESMGPMFEQYFRNATMLVIEDPDTGSTLLDVSRVLSNKTFRELKLSRCKNPIIVQFWKEIAERAGGEGALANIVPYITSKFDVFLANDIMRPIIAQEKSTFNFRDIMDEKKILLVNLSKGRLGDINANLIGLIIVGKILMSSLSRVDAIGANLPPFYLYIDEFQNITTNSIATILSEARKYKLSLTIAHQFIAQLEEGIKNAVFGNVGSICAFRVGSDDAEYLAKQFAPTFSAEDLMNIDNRHAYLRLLVNGRPATPFDIETQAVSAGDRTQVDKIIELSRLHYGRNRDEVEKEIRNKYTNL